MHYYCQVAVLVHNKHSLHCGKILTLEVNLGLINRGRVLPNAGRHRIDSKNNLLLLLVLATLHFWCTTNILYILETSVQFILQIFSSHGYKTLIKNRPQASLHLSWSVERVVKWRERRGMDARGRARNRSSRHARETWKSGPVVDSLQEGYF